MPPLTPGAGANPVLKLDGGCADRDVEDDVTVGALYTRTMVYSNSFGMDAGDGGTSSSSSSTSFVTLTSSSRSAGGCLTTGLRAIEVWLRTEEDDELRSNRANGWSGSTEVSMRSEGKRQMTLVGADSTVRSGTMTSEQERAAATELAAEVGSSRSRSVRSFRSEKVVGGEIRLKVGTVLGTKNVERGTTNF